MSTAPPPASSPPAGSSQAMRLMTAEQYAETDIPGLTELVRGEVIHLNVPRPRHGVVCARIASLLFHHCDQHEFGRVMSNDTGVVTERGPDTVRGADVCVYSFKSIPPGPLPDHYLNVPPEVVVEVLSPSDTWPMAMAKADEYLEAGVLAVCCIDPQRCGVRIFRRGQAPETLDDSQTLRLPEIQPTFDVKVSRLFLNI